MMANSFIQSPFAILPDLHFPQIWETKNKSQKKEYSHKKTFVFKNVANSIACHRGQKRVYLKAIAF